MRFQAPHIMPYNAQLPLQTSATHLLSDSNSSLKASVWNLLSHMYREVLMGLKGSKSMLTFFSLLSSVKIVPVYTTNPLGGTCSHNCPDHVSA